MAVSTSVPTPDLVRLFVPLITPFMVSWFAVTAMVRAPEGANGVSTLSTFVPMALVSVPPSQTGLPFKVQPPLLNVMVLVITA